ncbi:MAG: adenosylcobinamide-GDP ribazoletransferase [Rikenellaceae bacterium]
MNTLFNSLLYYSRIPIPFKVKCNSEILSRALRFLPLVGLIVGAIGYLAFYLASLFLPHSVAIIATIIAMVLSTGALHEDGFADFCDGFGGGYDKEAVLRIMKDSCIGCYGVIGLILIFMLRYSLLSSFDSKDLMMVVILSQGASRLAPVFMVRTSSYARVENAKSSQSALGISNWGVVVAMIFALTPLFLIGWCFSLAYVFIVGVVFLLFRAYLHRRIGGFTGDTLGALQIICEILFYVTFIGVSNLN